MTTAGTFSSEQDFVTAIVDLAMHCRRAVCHFRAARTRSGYRTAVQGHVGFPDLVIAYCGLVLIREAKVDGGRLTPEQVDWARQITGDPHWREPARVGATAADRRGLLFDIWRPRDWAPLIIPTLTGRQP